MSLIVKHIIFHGNGVTRYGQANLDTSIYWFVQRESNYMTEGPESSKSQQCIATAFANAECRPTPLSLKIKISRWLPLSK